MGEAELAGGAGGAGGAGAGEWRCVARGTAWEAANCSAQTFS